MRESRTLKEEFLSTFEKVTALESEYAECEKNLANAGDDADVMQKMLDRMAELQTELDAAEATAVERKVDKVLGAMGFTPEDASLPVSAFSGGWKMRIGLGKILLQEPQVRPRPPRQSQIARQSPTPDPVTRNNTHTRTAKKQLRSSLEIANSVVESRPRDYAARTTPSST